MNLFQRIKPVWIIHIFALLHLVTALCCRLAGVDDELLLTMLTMAMTLIICLKKDLSIEFTASMIIVGNILGYLLGTLGANLMGLAISSPYLIQPLSTFITTEILGWCIVAIAGIFKLGKSEAKKESFSSPYMKWLLLAAGSIFMMRIVVAFIFSQLDLDQESIYNTIKDIVSNSVGILILVCLNILYIRKLRIKYKNSARWSKVLSISCFMVACALLETIIAGSGLPFRINEGFFKDFPLLFLISLLAQITAYCLIYIVNYAVSAKTEMDKAKEKAHIAQYRYMKLKGQVNPHLLFNSLNILDCLICEEETERASTYTHKLAGIYRYMIKSEDEELVPLRDELMFVEQYVDLLKLRFPEGFDVEVNVSEKVMSRYVLPCSIQLLIENATKHNAVCEDNPLIIRIEADQNDICVTNNRIPKMTKSPSTGLGQKYIRQMYFDLTGKEIQVVETEQKYSVTLPLI